MRPIYAQTLRATSHITITDVLGAPMPWMRDAACARVDPEL